MKTVRGALSALKSGEGLKGQLMRGGVGSIAVKIASTGLNLILAIVLARLLGAEGFGVYSFIFALVTILAIPAQMGLPNLVVRETAKAQVAERWDIIKGLWRWSSLMALGMSAMLVILGGAAAFIFADRFTPMQLSTFWWALALVPLVALGNLRGAALRGLRKVVQGQLPEFVLRPLFLIVLVGLTVVWSRESLNASNAMMLNVFAAISAFAFGAVMLWRASPKNSAKSSLDPTTKSQWMTSIIPLAMFEGIFVVNQNVGTLVTGVLAGDVEAGIYRLAFQGAMTVGFALSVANSLVAPYIARFYAQASHEKLQYICRVSSRFIFIFAVAAFLVFLIGGQNLIVMLLGPEFAAAYLPLIVIAGGQVVSAFFANVGILLNMTGNERVVWKVLLGALLINVVFASALVPVYGGLGAAIAATLSVTLWKVWLWSRVNHLLGVDSSALGRG